MPYVDPEKAREANREAQRRRRARIKGMTGNDASHPASHLTPPGAAPSPHPKAWLFEPVPGHEADAERLLSAFPSDWTAVLHAMVNEGKLGKMEGARVLGSQWRSYTLAALSHHLAGGVHLFGCPKWGAKALWGAATVATAEDRDALLAQLKAFGVAAYWAEFPWLGFVIFCFLRRPLAAGVIGRFLGRAALAAGVHASAVPRRRKYHPNGQVPVLLPYRGGAYPLHDAEGRPIPLEALPGALVRNPRPPKLDKNGGLPARSTAPTPDLAVLRREMIQV